MAKMENPWLTVALAPPLKPPIPVGNLSHSPPQPDPPDPPDPLQFPPLPSPLSGGQNPPKRCAFSPLSLNSTVPPVPITSTPPSGTAVTPVFGSLPATTTSAAQLLAAYSPNPFCGVENPRSGSSTVPQGPSITVNLPYSLTGPGTLPTPPLPPTQLPSPLKPPLLPQSPLPPPHPPKLPMQQKPKLLSIALSGDCLPKTSLRQVSPELSSMMKCILKGLKFTRIFLSVGSLIEFRLIVSFKMFSTICGAKESILRFICCPNLTMF
ncbi:hypothetical protein YC2023_008200 [Brassica napus]